MADFSKYSNWSPETAFTEIIFGANAPVLETELNELQQIISNKFELFFKSWGNLVFPLSDNYYEISGNTITIKDCVILCEGKIFYLNSSSVTIPEDSVQGNIEVGIDTSYPEIVKGNTRLTSYGDTKGEQIENPIIDSRFSIETSRRKAIRYKLVYSEMSYSSSYTRIARVKRDSETKELSIRWDTAKPVTTLDLENYQAKTNTLVKAKLETEDTADES